jgi:serine/threonine protein kinase
MLTGRYEIRGKLGQGGLGAIYLAYDQMLHREVALKRIITTDAHASNPEASSQLAKEAGALSALQHPHIVTIFDVGVDHEGPFVVMELLQGKTVDDVVEAAVFTWEDFREFALQTQEALIAAQDLNMVHRDLKPTNIMLTWLPSGKFQVKIVDFGLAKYTPKPSLQTTDQTDSVFGSIFFMAPEQFERVELDARTDMYAIGCVYYYALTGLHPFGGDTGPQVMASHLHHQVYPLHDIRPDLPRWVSDWIMWHINRLPEHRPAQARQALEVFLQNAQRHDADAANSAAASTPQIRPPAPLTSLLKTAPQRILPPERIGRSSVHTGPLVSSDPAPSGSELDSIPSADESPANTMSEQPNPPARPRLIIPGAPAQANPAAAAAPAAPTTNRPRLLIPGATPAPAPQPELAPAPEPSPEVAVAVHVPVAPEPVALVEAQPLPVAAPEPEPLPEPEPEPVVADVPVAVAARPRLLIPGAVPTATPVAPIAPIAEEIPAAIPVAVPVTPIAAPPAPEPDYPVATPVAYSAPEPEPAPQPAIVTATPIPQPAIFPPAPAYPAEMAPAPAYAAPTPEELVAPAPEPTMASTMPAGFRPVYDEPVVSAPAELPAAPTPPAPEAVAIPAPQPIAVPAPPPVIVPVAAPIAVPAPAPVVAPPAAAPPPPPIIAKPALQMGPSTIAPARPVATSVARPTSAPTPATVGLKTAAAAPTASPATNPAPQTNPALRPTPAKKQGMSNSAKAVLATVLGLFVIIAAAVLISTSAKSKINKRYNALVELAAMANTKELPVSSKDLDILLSESISLAASSSRETVYKALYIAESADGSDIDAKLVNFALQTPMNEDIRVNLLSRVIAGRIKRGHADPATAEALIAYIKSNPKPSSAAAAIGALREMATDDHFADLLQLLQFASEPSVRKACEEVVIQIVKKSTNRAALDQSAEPAFASASSPEVKQALVRVLGATGTPKAKEVILAQLQGSDKALQIAAADATKHWPDESLLEDIIAALATTEDPALRRRMFHSCREFLLNESKRSDDRNKALWQALADAAKGEEEQVAVISSLVMNSSTNRTSWAPEIIRKYEESSGIDRVIDMAGKALNRLQEKNQK